MKSRFNRVFSAELFFFWFTISLVLCALLPIEVQASKIDLLTFDAGRTVKAEIENGLKTGSDGCTEVTELSIDTDTWLMTIAIVLNVHHRWPSIRHPTTMQITFQKRPKRPPQRYNTIQKQIAYRVRIAWMLEHYPLLPLAKLINSTLVHD